MKNYNIFFLIIFLIIFSCSDKNDSMCLYDPIETPVAECVSEEEITTTFDDFESFDKGLQEAGSAKGIKISQDWEASLFFVNPVFGLNLDLFTYWNDFGNLLLGEIITFQDIPSSSPTGCFYLTANESSADSIKCRYVIRSADIVLRTYELDPTKENKLDIIEYDHANGILKARMKASFTLDDPVEGYYPAEVRFFNVEIESN